MRDYYTPCLDDVDHDDTPCLDTSFHDHEMDIGEPRTVSRDGSWPLDTYNALTTAIACMRDQIDMIDEDDRISPFDAEDSKNANARRRELSNASITLQMIFDQRGCESLDPACEGRLVSLIDIIVFG